MRKPPRKCSGDRIARSMLRIPQRKKPRLPRQRLPAVTGRIALLKRRAGGVSAEAVQNLHVQSHRIAGARMLGGAAASDRPRIRPLPAGVRRGAAQAGRPQPGSCKRRPRAACPAASRCLFPHPAHPSPRREPAQGHSPARMLGPLDGTRRRRALSRSAGAGRAAVGAIVGGSNGRCRMRQGQWRNAASSPPPGPVRAASTAGAGRTGGATHKSRRARAAAWRAAMHG